jgi:hypothetical protein
MPQSRSPRTIDIDKVFRLHHLIRDGMFRYAFHAKAHSDAVYQNAMLRLVNSLRPEPEVFWDEDDFPYTIQAGIRRYIV